MFSFFFFVLVGVCWLVSAGLFLHSLRNPTTRAQMAMYVACTWHVCVCGEGMYSPRFHDTYAQTSHDGPSRASIHPWVTKCIKVHEEFTHTRCTMDQAHHVMSVYMACVCGETRELEVGDGWVTCVCVDVWVDE